MPANHQIPPGTQVEVDIHWTEASDNPGELAYTLCGTVHSMHCKDKRRVFIGNLSYKYPDGTTRTAVTSGGITCYETERLRVV